MTDPDELDELDPELLERARAAAEADAVGPEDPGHYLPDDAWEDVVRQAAAIRSLPDAAPAGDPGRALAAGIRDLTIPAKFHGGAQVPTLQVIHDAETPLDAGYAVAIGNYFAAGPPAGTSAHRMVDPTTVVRMLLPTTVGYHCGSRGNSKTIGYEQAGYARFTRAQWLTADGRRQIEALASIVAEDAEKYGIPDRRLTNAELARWAANGRRLEDGGRVTHDQIGDVLGGTSHWDPGPNYPHDELDAAITRYRTGQGDDMFGDEDRAKLDRIDSTLRTAVGAGQTGFPGTVKAILGTVQTLVNRANTQDAQLRAILAAAQDDEFELTGEQIDRIAAELAELAGDVSTEDVLREIAVRLDPAPA